MSEIDFKKDVWVLIQRGAKAYIGKYAGESRVTLAGDVADRQYVLDLVSKDGAVPLNPCFEYFNSVVQNPQNPGQIGRQPLPLLFDITSGPVKVYVKADVLMFLGDAEEQDQKGYKDLVARTMEFFVQARAGRAGLVTPNAGMPNNVSPFRR